MAPKTKSTESEQAQKPISEMNLLEKINNIRKVWSATEVEKGGKGKAGGGSTYDYYKPQQIIDFCLQQELAHNLFSDFKINSETGFCHYFVTDIPTGEIKDTQCPFDVPRKMAASEAQQVGAAMTYFQRRLAMSMYKIEDNSKESVQVLSDADYSVSAEIPAPVIPVPPAPISAPTQPEIKQELNKPEQKPTPPPAPPVITPTPEKQEEKASKGVPGSPLPTILTPGDPTNPPGSPLSGQVKVTAPVAPPAPQPVQQPKQDEKEELLHNPSANTPPATQNIEGLYD